MFFANLTAAIVVSAALTAVFVPLLGWRRPGRPDDAATAAVFLFLLLFLPVWSIGTWVLFWGPLWGGVAWLDFLLVGLFVALLVGVLAPPPPRGSRADARAAASPSVEVGPRPVQRPFGPAFWTLAVLALVVVTWAHV